MQLGYALPFGDIGGDPATVREVATLAAETGYGSEAAFSRAFKKVVGMPPSAWRHQQVTGRAA